MKTLFLALAAIAVAVPAAQAQMNHGAGHGEMHAEKAAAAISGTGVVNAVDPAKRTVNVTHEPIAALGWPAMTMDFAVPEGVDLSALKQGAQVAFTLSRGADGIYMIDGITTR
jgi:Cu/Ag efflux protein CusF